MKIGWEVPDYKVKYPIGQHIDCKQVLVNLSPFKFIIKQRVIMTFITSQKRIFLYLKIFSSTNL